MYTIATLDDLRRRLGLSETDADSDQDLLHSLQEASHLIESLTQRRYCPRLQSRTVPLGRTAPRLLILPDDLLELRAVNDAGGEMDLDRFLRLPEDPNMPASILHLARGVTFRLDASAPRAVTIEGIWGWHDRWTQAWVDSGDTVRDSALSETGVTVTVNDSAGSDADGNSPRFQAGHLLRIKDEYLRVTAVDRQNHHLTVQRGAQGTLASTHRRGATIETYSPSLPIRDLTVRYAELMMKSHGPLADEPSSLLSRMRRLTV
ncbi:MAG: hypothetical protein OXG78_01295 [Chloroflexi bacterium]|nr:hypothetical protein [Chloroflexota bacterium]